jgi:hypothetical protein
MSAAFINIAWNRGLSKFNENTKQIPRVPIAWSHTEPMGNHLRNTITIPNSDLQFYQAESDNSLLGGPSV